MLTRPVLNRPVYAQLHDILVARICAGGWKSGVALPSEGDLAREYGVSCGTVRKALGMLEKSAIITRRQGRGTFLVDPSSEASALRFAKIQDSQGQVILGSVAAPEICEMEVSDPVRTKLKISTGERVYMIRRLRSAGDRPFIWEEAAVPAALFPGLSQKPDAARSLHAIAESYGYLVGRSEERIAVATATAKIADALSLPVGAPVAILDRVAHDINGIVLEWRVGWTDLRLNQYHVVL